LDTFVEQSRPETNQQAQAEQYDPTYGRPSPPPETGIRRQPPSNGRNRGALKAGVVLVIVIVIAIILIMPSTQDFLKRSLINPFQESYPEYAEISFQRSFSVGANGGNVGNFSINSVVPQNISQEGVNLQTIESFSVTPGYYEVARGNAVGLTWSPGPITGQQTYSVILNYQIKETTRIWSLGQSDSGTTDQVPASLGSNFLGDEWKIQATEPAIVALSKQINGDQQNVYAILKSTYDWVTKNIAYPGSPQSGDPKSSLETLQSRVGDCDDQSNLYLGLIRAAGVPGWLQLGALYDKVTGQLEGHAWVQTYIPYVNGGGVYVNIDLVNFNFLVWKPSLFCEYTDNGNGTDLQNYYYTFKYTGQPTFSDSYSVLHYSESPSVVTRGQMVTFSGCNTLMATSRS
jgi:hypothetical protein